MTKISVIVPVYNAEKYLNRCIDSILNQTFKDFELILINDGSSDKSIEILNAYEKIDSRIKVINNENNGVSKTRNIGIGLATGEYIQFIDSDDFIDKNMFKETVEFLEVENADVIITGLFLDIESTNGIDTSIQTFENCISRNSKDIAKKLLTRLNGTYINSPVNKLYKRNIILENNILMDESINLGEDLIFNLAYLSYCDCVIFNDKCYYHYCMKNEENLTAKYRKDKLDLMEVLYNECKQFLLNANLNEEYIKVLNSIFIKWMYYCYIDLNSSDCNLTFKEKYRYIKYSIKKYNNIINNSKSTSILLKVLKVSLMSSIVTMALSKIIYFIKTNMRRIIYR